MGGPLPRPPGAPATAMERRLGEKGGDRDCEIFLNAYQPTQELWTPSREYDEDGVMCIDDAQWPKQLPACRGVRAGSTQGCTMWVRQRRRGWWW